jgi:hypothetical protein
MATQARRDPQRRMQNVTQQHSCAVWLTPWLGLLTVSRRRFPRSAQFLSSAVTHHTAPHRTAPHRTAPRTPHHTPTQRDTTRAARRDTHQGDSQQHNGSSDGNGDSDDNDDQSHAT